MCISCGGVTWSERGSVYRSHRLYTSSTHAGGESVWRPRSQMDPSRQWWLASYLMGTPPVCVTGFDSHTKGRASARLGGLSLCRFTSTGWAVRRAGAARTRGTEMRTDGTFVRLSTETLSAPSLSKG